MPFLNKKDAKTNLGFGRVALLIAVPSILIFIISFVVYIMGWSPIVLLASTALYFITPFMMLKRFYAFPTARALIYSSTFFCVVFVTQLAFELGSYATQNV
ncbi:hypothetical protein PBPRB1707 [Photobacterium profundum SS9]|uniref:Uncharacterized protein n=1 Tax=Photobacterium profundum (strain SS9) TaxID=298386 RepID=Q6LGL3_PHOPR|nr:hypothetical protein PBPRB1707 [Photobacterium profundum SS9]